MYKIAKSNLPALFRAIAETKELYLPIRRAGQVNFGPWSEDAEVDVETLKTVKSPKDVFFPQSENLYSCEREGKDIKIEPQALQDQEFVVFGMKACDIKGVEVLDKVFLADPIDTFYAARRDHGIIVAMACHEPEESCFCKVFGVDCADPEKSAADVAVWMLGDDLIWKAITEKGEALTKAVESLLENADADSDKLEEEKNNIRAIVEKLPYSNLSLEGWGGELIEGKADRDHLHLLFSLPPDKELARYIGLMKQVSARQVRKKYKEQLKEYLWGDSFWTDSYYLGSTGGANLEVIEEYIKKQGQPKRKYVRKSELS